MKDILLWLYWHPFRRIVQGLPISFIYPLGNAMGMAMSYLPGGKRMAFEAACVKLFGGGPGAAEVKRITASAFKALALNELEMMLYPRLSEKNINMLVRWEGRENLDRALADGKGAMLAFGHFGANQMIMPAVGYNGYRMCQLSAPATVWKEVLTGRKFSPMQEKALELRWKHEESLPVRHINIFGSLKEAFKCLKGNEVLGVALDGGGGRDRVDVDFLGRKALFSTGAMDIALRTGCSVLPTFMVRDKRGCSTLIIEPPLSAGGGGREDIIRNMIVAFALRLEEYVLKYPGHYLNFLALRLAMAERGDTPFIVERD